MELSSAPCLVNGHNNPEEQGALSQSTLSEKKGIDSFNIILGINVIILAAAGIMFGWDKALYSIIFQYASTQVLHVLYKKYQEQTLFIVTDHAEEIYKEISEITHHGATIMKGEGPYDHKQRQIVCFG